MNYPPRLSHLANLPVLVARLAPTYAAAHGLDDEEARLRLDGALRGGLRERLLASTWQALLGTTKRLNEAGLLEKVARALQENPTKKGRVAPLDPGWSAFLILVDLEVGTASEAARKVMESEEGRRRSAAGLAEVGAFLARELLRK
jgi:hypothetical protein